MTPGPPDVPNGTAAAQGAAPYIFPAAYFDPNSGNLVRATVPPGVRLLAPGAAGNPLLVGNGPAGGPAAAGGGVAPGALPGGPPASLPLGVLGPGQLPQAGLYAPSTSLAGSPSLSLPGSGGAPRRDSLDRAAFSPGLDKAKALQAAGWPYNALGLAAGALTPPPGSLNLLQTRLPGGPGGGGDRPGFGGRNGTINLFGSTNLFSGGGGGKHRHNSIDGGKQVNRSKLLEDFR